MSSGAKRTLGGADQTVASAYARAEGGKNTKKQYKKSSGRFPYIFMSDRVTRRPGVSRKKTKQKTNGSGRFPYIFMSDLVTRRVTEKNIIIKFNNKTQTKKSQSWRAHWHYYPSSLCVIGGVVVVLFSLCVRAFSLIFNFYGTSSSRGIRCGGAANQRRDSFGATATQNHAAALALPTT